jgi:hypothetical protein
MSAIRFFRSWLLFVALSFRPFNQVGRFDRSLLYLMGLASASIDYIQAGLTIRRPGKDRSTMKIELEGRFHEQRLEMAMI